MLTRELIQGPFSSIFRRPALRLVLFLIPLLAACGDDNPTRPSIPNVVPHVDGLAVVQGPLTNPATGHTYYRLATSNWSSAAVAAARQFGGRLVQIDDAAENTFVQLNFARGAGSSGRVWIGLSDAASEGNFVYTDGTAPVYTQWEPGEPNNRNDEDFVAMYANNGNWVDVMDLANPPLIGNIYGVVEVDTPAPVYIVQGPVTNPINGHVYYRLSNSTWTVAEAYAAGSLGGHLVTIEDAAENQFVLQTFADAPGSGRVWLGLTDSAAEGTFVNVDGSAVAYTNWEPGEPNDSNGEDYVAMYSGNGRWVDVQDLANPPGIGNVYGVVEVVPTP